MRTRLFLSPQNNKLVGAYPASAEHIHIVLDSSEAPFTVQLPDVTQPEHREFIFYNYPSSGNGHPVTIVPVTGQFLIINDTEHVINPKDTVSFTADLKNNWLLTDVNTFAEDITSISSNYDITAADLGNVLVFDSATPLTVTLPTAAATGNAYKLVNVGAGNVTISSAGSVINGDVSQYLVQWDVFVIYDYAVGKWVIGL